MNLEEVKQLIALVEGKPNVTLNLVIDLDKAGGSTPPEEEEKPKIKAVVETGDKANNRAKVRPQPNTTVSEIAYVFDGQEVELTGKFLGAFAEIVEPAGWVEKIYLVY